LINLMPPHLVYCEPFLGGGAVMRLKRPAEYNIGVDLDAGVIAAWRSRGGEKAAGPPDAGMPLAPASGGNATGAGTGGSAADLVGAADLPSSADAGGSAASRRRRTAETPRAATGGALDATGSARFRFLRGDALTFLASYPFQPLDLVYCDPPYLHSTRSGGRLYRHELEDWQHAELLATLLELPCRVMISGYWSEMYAEAFSGWNAISFESMTRGGMATEWLWYNYPEPTELHDYRFLGTGNRERTDLKRQKERWVRRLERMPALKKQALLSAIASHGGNADGILHEAHTTMSSSALTIPIMKGLGVTPSLDPTPRESSN
jgi:hypothetical protein